MCWEAQAGRGTLREALRQLEQEGLLSAGHRGRLSVRHLDEKEIRDIFAVRAALETLAARTLCELPDHARAIDSLHQKVDLMEAAEDASLAQRIESDMEFHRALCRLTGNETLMHSWESLEGSIRMSIMFAGREKGVKNMSVDRHHDIVAAIETRDASQVRKTIREHDFFISRREKMRDHFTSTRLATGQDSAELNADDKVTMVMAMIDGLRIQSLLDPERPTLHLMEKLMRFIASPEDGEDRSG